MTPAIRQMYSIPHVADHPNEAADAIAATLINRDLSLLEFFRRVLDEALNEKLPIVDYESLGDDERRSVDEYFEMKIYPVLTPQAVDPTHPFPYVSGGNINIALIVRPKLNKRIARAMTNVDEFFVRIKVPSFIPRF